MYSKSMNIITITVTVLHYATHEGRMKNQWPGWYGESTLCSYITCFTLHLSDCVDVGVESLSIFVTSLESLLYYAFANAQSNDLLHRTDHILPSL